MNSIKSIKNIINKLTEEEIRILLRVFKSNISKSESKSIHLVKLFLSEKKYSLSEIQINIYGKLNYSAFNKLLNRVKYKIFETIFLDLSISSNNFSRRNKVNIDLRKKLLQADILQLKGLRNDVLPIYNHIIVSSKKFELYDLQIQALISKQRLQSINSKVQSFKKINNEIIYAENCLNALKDSNNIYKEILNKINNSTNYLEYISDLELFINKLEDYYNIFKSPTIGFYLFTLSAEMYENKLLYNKANDNLEKVKKILLVNDSAYTDNRYGTNLLNLANNNIFLFQFDKSIILANESKKYFKNLPLSLKIVDELLFYVYFYKFDFEKCNKILLDNVFQSDNESIKNKFQYFQACLYFVKGSYKDSLFSLLNYNEIDRDKEGWNINRRILIILNRIELNEYESVDLQIQNLDKFIKRISSNKKIMQRSIVILRILTKLIQENFNYNIVYQKRIKYFKLLESESAIFHWQVKSPELVIFNDWFKFKMKVDIINSSLKNK